MDSLATESLLNALLECFEKLDIDFLEVVTIDGEDGYREITNSDVLTVWETFFCSAIVKLSIAPSRKKTHKSPNPDVLRAWRRGEVSDKTKSTLKKNYIPNISAKNGYTYIEAQKEHIIHFLELAICAEESTWDIDKKSIYNEKCLYKKKLIERESILPYIYSKFAVLKELFEDIPIHIIANRDDIKWFSDIVANRIPEIDNDENERKFAAVFAAAMVLSLNIKDGNYQEAIKNYMRYIEKEPGDYAVYNSIGSAYAQSLDEEDIKLSKTNYEKALTINPNYYQCYNNLAIWYLKFKKDYYQAIDFSNKCLSINTNYYYSYNVRGLAYIELGEYEKAFDDLCTSIRLSPPEHYLPMTNMGYLIEKGFADYRVSKLFYIALKKIGDVNAFVALANQIFKVEQDLDSAMKIANEVLQISPDNILMIFLKAMIYFEKHELITACDLCDKCIELENTYWPAYFLKIYMQDENLYDVKYKNLPIEIKKDIKECFDELNKTYENKNYKYIYEYIRQQYNYLSKATVQRKNYIKLKNGLEEFGQELTF